MNTMEKIDPQVDTSVEENRLKSLFSKKKFTKFMMNDFLGNFVGFVVGMWTTSWFSYEVYEKKGLNNLFGLAKRKKIVVNTTPEWVQWVVSAIIGYIVLELIRYFFEKKMYLTIWDWVQKKIKKVDPEDGVSNTNSTNATI